MKKNIIILTGGSSAEKNISVKSADVMNNVLQKHYNTKTILCSFEDKLQFMNLKKEKIELKKYIKKNLFSDEVVICMGAGSISNWIREISTEI